LQNKDVYSTSDYILHWVSESGYRSYTPKSSAKAKMRRKNMQVWNFYKFSIKGPFKKVIVQVESLWNRAVNVHARHMHHRNWVGNTRCRIDPFLQKDTNERDLKIICRDSPKTLRPPPEHAPVHNGEFSWERFLKSHENSPCNRTHPVRKS